MEDMIPTVDLDLHVTLSFVETHKFLNEERDIYTTFVQQGGSRSGKTYGIAQALTLAWYEAGMRGEEQRISCVRDAMPALKATAMRDVIGIMQDWGMYDEKLHNKTDNILTLGRSEFEFFSLDNPQKVRGRGRDILWANEGNEISWEAFKQLNQRTTRQSIVDYNPSDEYSWIYDYLLGEKMEEPRADVKYLQTTYKDNPFLPDKIVKDIEWYQEVDPNAWRIYGLGERGFSGATIYPSFHVTKAWPESKKHRVFGLDFGFNNPSALVEVARPTEREMYFRQCIYEAKLTNTDLIKRLSEFVPPGAIIYADAAEPGRIEEIRRAGFNVRMADKRPHSVRLGIDFIKRHKIFVHESSTDLVAEFRGYKWRTTKDGEILDEPLKLKDHALDAARYAAATAWGRPKRWLAA